MTMFAETLAVVGGVDTHADTIRRRDVDEPAAGEHCVDEVGARLFDLLITVAGGTTTASERLGFGEEEFVPWQMGVVT